MGLTQMPKIKRLATYTPQDGDRFVTIGRDHTGQWMTIESTSLFVASSIPTRRANVYLLRDGKRQGVITTYSK